MSNAQYIDRQFYLNKQGSVGYDSDGDAYNNGNCIDNYGDKYGVNDIILKRYNGLDSPLLKKQEQ